MLLVRKRAAAEVRGLMKPQLAPPDAVARVQQQVRGEGAAGAGGEEGTGKRGRGEAGMGKGVQLAFGQRSHIDPPCAALPCPAVPCLALPVCTTPRQPPTAARRTRRRICLRYAVQPVPAHALPLDSHPPLPPSLYQSLQPSLPPSPQLRGDDDDELQVGATVLSLRCPLLGSRIRTPGRFAEVPGLACFDLEAFLDSAARTRKWQCPTSMAHTSVHSLMVGGKIVDTSPN